MVQLKLISVVILLFIVIGGVWWWKNRNPVRKPELIKKSEVKPIRSVETDRLALFAIVNNNNMAVVKFGYPKQDIIFINSDWTIDRMPPHVQLGKEDEEFVRRFVKRAEP